MFLFDIFFPKRCLFCGQVLVKGEKNVCLNCYKYFPYKANAEEEYRYKITEVAFEHLDIFLDYAHCKTPIHRFKYGGDITIGRLLASLWAEYLKEKEWIKEIDLIIPIPLHRNKLYERGFNQSEVLGNVLSKRLGVPIVTNLVKRKVNNPPQITAENRWENVRDVFALKRKPDLENKHILIIDDVITTSATSNYFVKTLREIKNLKVSFAYLSSNY